MQTLTLTYADLAARLGVREDSARKTAKRRRWQMTKGNDGRMRVQVPVDDLTLPPVPINPEQAATIARLETELAGLREIVARADDQRQAAQLDAERWRIEAARWQAIADRPMLQRLFGKKP